MIGFLVSLAGLNATSTWIGTTGNFQNAANWSTGEVPNGTDNVVVANGGTAQVSTFNPTQKLTVDGASTIQVLSGNMSKLGALGDMSIGLTGLGTITIGNQATLINNDLESWTSYLGYGSGATGIVTSTGGIFSTGDHYVGYEGNGTVTLNSGSQLFTSTAWLGFRPGSVGTVELNNSSWIAPGILAGDYEQVTVGEQGRGAVSATNSQIQVGNLILAATAGTNGTVTVSGGNLTSSGTVFVGLNGAGSFSANNTAVGAREFFVGRNAGASGVATLSGGSLTLSADLHVGALGTGTFTLQNGGTISSDIANIGFGSAAVGVLNVSSGNWTNSRGVFVGVSGNGTLNIGADGSITSESGFLAQNSSGVASVAIDGGRWTMSNSLVIGVNGTATLAATNGAVISSPFSQLGLNAGSSGVASLDDSSWTVSQELTIGQLGHGELTLTNGSSLSTPSIELAAAVGVNASLSVVDSTVVATTIDVGAGNATAFFSAARLELPTNVQVVDTLLISGFAPGQVTIGSGGLTVDTAGGNAQIANSLTGNGSLTKTGVGRLRLNNANALTGGTLVEQGILEIADNASLGAGGATIGTAELRAIANITLSTNPSSLTVAAGQTATFSATTNSTLTVAVTNFTLQDGARFTAGSAGNNGVVVFSPTNLNLPASVPEVVVAAGQLVAGNSALEQLTAAATSTTVAAGATLNFQDQLSGAGIKALYGAGTVNIGSNSSTTLAVSSGNFSGSLTGAGGLNKISSGTLTISGNANPFNGGTTVNGGTLIVNGDLTFGLGQVQVNDNGTLAGSGIVGGVSLEGGTLAPGNSAGTLTTEEILWYDGVILFDLGATQAASDLIATDTLIGLGSTYDFRFVNQGMVVNTPYNLITFGLTENIGVSDFRFLNDGGFDGDFTLSGNTLQFTVTTIPEPSTWALLAAAALLGGLGRKRSKRGV